MDSEDQNKSTDNRQSQTPIIIQPQPVTDDSATVPSTIPELTVTEPELAQVSETAEAVPLTSDSQTVPDTAVAEHSESTSAVSDPKPAVTSDTTTPVGGNDGIALSQAETPAGPVSTEQSQPQQTPTAENASLKKKIGGKFKLALIALVAVMLLAGASAGAYFGYVLPNKPENQVARGFMNLMSNKQINITGKIDYTPKDKGVAVAVDYQTKFNLEKKEMSVAGDVGVAGASFPFDSRMIDNDFYIKVGGLDGLKNLGAALGQDKGSKGLSMYASALGAANDKWFVIDRSFIGQSKEISCTLDNSWMFSKEDNKKIETAYVKHPLLLVKNQSDADVNGIKTTKFEVAVNSEDETKAFFEDLKTTSIFEAQKKCSPEADSQKTEDTIKDKVQNDEAQPKMFAYMTKDKQIKRIEIISEDKKSTQKMTADFDNKEVKIEKPDNAKPIQDLLGILLGQTGASKDSGASSSAASQILPSLL